MADRTLYTVEAAVEEASLIRLTLANPDATPSPTVGHIRLFNGDLVPTETTTQAELEAAETLLVGYPTGGYPVEEMGPVIAAPGGGVVIQTPIVDAVYASGDPATIGGYWYEDSDGNVREVGIYDPPRTLAAIPDGFPIVMQWGYGRNV